jgi:hypothetical protein
VDIIRIGAACDEFCRSFPGYGKQQHILNCSEELMSRAVCLVVFRAQNEEIPHLLAEPFFRCPDVANAFQHLVEMVRATIRVLETFVVHDEALEQILLKDATRPPAKLHSPGRADAVADGKDGVKIVEGNRPLNLTIALGLNCQGFLDSCRRVQFLVLKYVFQVERNVLLGGVKQLRHLKLCQPDSVVLRPEVDPALAVFGCVENEHQEMAVEDFNRDRVSMRKETSSMMSGSPSKAVHSFNTEVPERLSDRTTALGKRRKLASAIISVDDQVGKLLRTLEKHGLRKNTLVIFSSDNGANGGDGGSSAPYTGGKGQGTQKEGWVRVPTIFSMPNTLPEGIQ